MVFYIGIVLIALAFAWWLWQVAPKRKKVTHYEHTYSDDKRREYLGYEEVWDGKYRWDHYFYEWWTALFGVLGILLACGVAMTAWGFGLAGLQMWLQADAKVEKETTYNLAALDTGEGIEGRFGGNVFISTGYINSYLTFNFLYEEKDGGVRLGNIYSYDGTVYEDEEDQPHVTEFTWHKYDPWISPYAAWKGDTYAFHVPEGSVVQGYEVKP